MLEDEDRPKKPSRLEKLMLDPMSVSDLRAYIDELGAEIARAEAEVVKRQGARGHAEGRLKSRRRVECSFSVGPAPGWIGR